jgi:hypothetical protein
MEPLHSLLNSILPPHHYPRAWESLGPRLTTAIQSDPTLSAGLARLDPESAAVFGEPFARLHPQQQSELLDRLELDQVRTRWEEPGAAEWLSRIVNVIGRAYHAERGDGAAGE